MTAIFIFRRDLRIEDNTGFEGAMKNFKKVIPIFILTPEQFGKKNEYRSQVAVDFMLSALADLNDSLCKYKSRLHIFQGDNVEILKKISKHLKFDAVIYNLDFTPYAQARDAAIVKWCMANNVIVREYEDYTLYNMGTVLTKECKHYSVYTAFRNNAITTTPRKVSKMRPKNLGVFKSPLEKHLNICGRTSKRRQALRTLANMRKFANYAKMRNDLTYETTNLSAHIKFGTVSIREVYHAIRNPTIRDQLWWREFYYNISYYSKNGNFGRNYDGRKIKWSNSPAKFARWTKGETGFPIVDAGMRQLNKTGYMHNRTRLITANFLVRLLDCDWRMGEKYFAQHLEDYDPMVNNGNWQWIAATGVDTSPDSQRIFNPWLQSAKYDKDAKYIKKWIPELKDVPSAHLHRWFKYHTYNKVVYPAPMIDYEEARQKTLHKYERK